MPSLISDKEELIRKGTDTVRKQSEMVSKAIKSKSSNISAIPNLNFLDIQRQIILVTEDIKKLGKSSFLMKMKNTLMQSNTNANGKNHIDGSKLTTISKKAGLSPLVAEVTKDPTSTASRVQFIRALIQDQRRYELQYYKDLMIQGALPIYIGKITPAALEVAGLTYRIYLRQLINEHKQHLLILRSDQLKRINIDLIPVESLIKVEPEQELTEKEAGIILETKLALKLLEVSRNLNTDIKTNITLPLDISEVEHLSPRHGAVMEFLGSQNIGNTYNRHQLIVRKSVAVMDVVKYLPYLHPVGLKMADKLEQVEHKLPTPFVIEGRIHMHAMKFLMLRMMHDEYTAKNALSPTFKKVVVAYRKALKRTSLSEPQSTDIPVLGEFAQVAYFSYQHRKLMNLTEGGVLEILKLGKKAVDAAMLVNRQYRKLQIQILTATSSLERPGKTFI